MSQEIDAWPILCHGLSWLRLVSMIGAGGVTAGASLMIYRLNLTARKKLYLGTVCDPQGKRFCFGVSGLDGLDRAGVSQSFQTHQKY